MALKYRSKTDYKQIFDGDKQGYNLGLDGAIFLKPETTPRVFERPSIGTQGSSTSDTTPSTDISAGTDTNFKIAVDGGAVVSVTLVVAGLNTGNLIAAALETAINNALIAAGQDGRVWVEFAGGLYVIHSQSTGLTLSSVVVTDGLTNNVADDLKIGVANGGVEVFGTDDTDFLLYTSGGPTYGQPIESNSHRSGRFHSRIIKKKKVAEFGFQTYVNMSGNAGDSLDTAVRLLWKNLLGRETVTASTEIKYTQDLPNFYFSMVRVSTIFAEYYTGSYVRENTLTFPGAGPSTCDWKGKASKAVKAGLGKVNGAVSGSATVVLDAGQATRYDATAPVMVIDPDGRTILAGADGTLTISTITLNTDTLVLSTTVTVADNGYIVPWYPGAIQQTGRDNVYTDLEGTFKLQAAGSAIDVTNIVLTINNNHNDLDGYYGRDANAGFVAGNRCDMKLDVTFDLTSQETWGEIVQSSRFGGFTPEIIQGTVGSGRYLQINAPNWIPEVPTIDVPENGPTPVTLSGMLYQSTPGARDPITVKWK